MSREYLVYGATLTAAWFVVVNATMCALATLLSIAIAKRSSSRHTPALWLALRLAPAWSAIIFAVAFFVPSYWKFEPREAVEGSDLSLAIFAAVGSIVIAAALVRGFAAWIGARRRVGEWMRHARPIAVAANPMPAFVVEADQPMIALVGVFRPRLLLTRGLLDNLTPAELEAAVAHEIEHRRSFDNLKRLLMRAAPDFLAYVGGARLMEQRWAAAAEHAADRIGGADPVDARCALASALVKVARLTPAAIPQAEPISTLIAGGDIAARVQRLLSDDPLNAAATSTRRALTIVTAAVSAVTVALAYGPLLRFVHEITEVLVRSLP